MRIRGSATCRGAPHTLRHTAARWAFMAGLTLEQATGCFATSGGALEDVCRSYSPHAQKDAAAIMDRILGKLRMNRLKVSTASCLISEEIMSHGEV